MTLHHRKALRGPATLVAALSFVALFTGCPNEQSSPTPTAIQLKGGGESYVEITAAASPPIGGSGPCKDGMLLAGAGDGTERILMGSLRGPAPTTYDLAEWNKTGWKKTGSLPPPLTEYAEISIGSDNQTATLANGDLLLMWNSGTLASIPNGASLSWWNNWHNTDTGDGTVEKTNFVGHPLFLDGKRKGFRGALILRRYSCAQGKWLKANVMDAAELQALDKNNNLQKGLNTYYPPYRGFDREEMYVDPWGVDPADKGKQRIYVSTRIEGGDETSMQVFTSPDSGEHWNPAVIKLNFQEPVVMTSTLGGRLFMLHPGKDPSKPVLDFSDDYGASLSSPEDGYDISYITPSPKAGEPPVYPLTQLTNVETGVGETGVFTLSLARTGKNGVLAVYPSSETVTVNGKTVKRQVAAVVWVMSKAKDAVTGQVDAPVVVPIKIIRAQNPEGSVLMPTFIQDDRPDRNVATNMLYWLETTSPPGPTGSVNLSARYLIFNGFTPDTEKVLSEPATWEMNNHVKYKALGDYMKGGFYAYKGTMNFVAVWPQVPADAAAKNRTQAYARVITLADSAKAAPPPATPEKMPGSYPAPHAPAKPAGKP